MRIKRKQSKSYFYERKSQTSGKEQEGEGWPKYIKIQRRFKWIKQPKQHYKPIFI